MIYGLFVIFAFYFLGNLVSVFTGNLIPGSVIGMICLFLCLMAGWIDSEKLRPVATSFTRHMALFFIPVGVGLMASYQIIGTYLPAIAVASVISTILVMASTAIIQQKLEQWKK